MDDAHAHHLALYYQAFARLQLAVDALRPLNEQARAHHLDPLTREVKAASYAYRQAAALDRHLALPPLLLAATNLMQNAWSNRDPHEASVLVASSLPSLPSAPEALRWPGEIGGDRWWESVASTSSSSTIGSMPPTPTQIHAPPPAVAGPTVATPTIPSAPPLQTTLQMTLPEGEYVARAGKRKERDGGSNGRTPPDETTDGNDDGRARRPRGKTLVITEDMLSAGLNDPPCERCRDTRRSCVRGPHAACLTCVAGKTACSLVPPKSSTNPHKSKDSAAQQAALSSSGAASSSMVSTAGPDSLQRRRVRAHKAEFHVDVSAPSGMPAPSPTMHTLPYVSAQQLAPPPPPPPSHSVLANQWSSFASVDPSQTLVTRAELLAAEARIEQRVRQIIQEEIAAALARAGIGGNGQSQQQQQQQQQSTVVSPNQ